MPAQSSGRLVSFAPLNREQRARRRQLSTFLVIAVLGGAAVIVPTLYDGRRPSNLAAAPAAFAYFPN